MNDLGELSMTMFEVKEPRNRVGGFLCMAFRVSLEAIAEAQVLEIKKAEVSGSYRVVRSHLA